ncbi:MAG: hypothetical protein IPO29_13180 [Anaerolineae bacterium]|nr:hypothetical protein [Anaerolineae bacterium]
MNKPAGISAVHDPNRSETEDMHTAVTGTLGKVWLVHRLDRDTSGVLIFARTEAAHRSLSLQFEEREAEKRYHALCVGAPQEDECVVERRCWSTAISGIAPLSIRARANPQSPASRSSNASRGIRCWRWRPRPDARTRFGCTPRRWARH